MRLILVFSFGLLLTACAPGVSEGPDEFGVVPSRPLEAPPSLTELPQPIPGAPNRADINPEAELLEALGGRTAGGGLPASDAPLVTFTSRFGVDPNIRSDLFAADAALRSRRVGGIIGLGGESYFRFYARQTLDPYREIERFRNAGVAVPTAPPAR